MNQSFMNLCSEFSNRVRYNLALVPFIPNDKILKVMEQDGWKKAPAQFTDQELASFLIETHHGMPFVPRTTICNAAGKDGVFGPDMTVRREYDSARRKAAAQVYGITD